MEADAPPVNFILRPHHMNLLVMITLLFRHFERQRFHPGFLLSVHELITNQISETVRPKTYAEITDYLNGAIVPEYAVTVEYVTALSPEHQNFGSVDRMTSFMSFMGLTLQDASGSNDDTDLVSATLRPQMAIDIVHVAPEVILRGAVKLLRDHHEWLMGNSNAGYDLYDGEHATGHVIWKTAADETEWASPQAYAEFERGLAINDSNVANESLRQFFEQHFHEGNDSGVRQHALLNLSRMYYLRSEFTAARKFILEGIKVARTAGDKETLQHCQSLFHRLPPSSGGRHVINDIQGALHPLEILFDVEKLLRVKSEQPLSAAFEKLTQAIGLYDHWIDTQNHIPEDREELGQHAVQSVIWSSAGCEKLAEIEEDIVTLFGEVGGDDNNVVTVALNRAYRRARQGEYQQALADLLEPDMWRGITMTDYTRWSWQIWNILALRASRRGQVRFYENFLTPRRPPGPFNPRSYFKANKPSTGSVIRDPLFEAIELRHANQPAHTVEHLLKSLWHAEYQFRFGFYRTGMILLADIGLEFGMTKRSKKIVENILPQVISGDDLEQRAFAYATLARCTIAAGEKSSDSLKEAIRYLQAAESDYDKIECLRPLADVQYLLAVLYHNLGMEEDRDKAASRNLNTDKEMEKEAAAFCDDWVSDVWQLHCDIGAALATR